MELFKTMEEPLMSGVKSVQGRLLSSNFPSNPKRNPFWRDNPFNEAR